MCPSNARPDFGLLFKASRKHLGLTQTEMAEWLGGSQSRLSKIEKSTLEPGAGDLWKVVNWICPTVALELEFRIVLAPTMLEMAIKAEAAAKKKKAKRKK